MTKKILVAVDMSKISESVFAYGCSLALRLNDEVTFIHVTPHPTLWRGYEQWLPAELNQEIEDVARKKLEYYYRKTLEDMPAFADTKHELVVRQGNPADTIIEYAKEHSFDLIVIGYRGQSNIERLVVGSTAANVARYAHCSVLIYRPGFDVL